MSEAGRHVEVTNKVGTMRASGFGQSGCDKAVMRTQQGPTVPPKRGAVTRKIVADIAKVFSSNFSTPGP